VVGLIFLVAAFAKFDYLRPLERDIMGFLRLRAEESPLGVQVLARLLLAAEIAIGVGLILPYWRRRLFLPAAMLMLAGFSVYLLTLDPAQENCGCFGFWLKMGPRASLLKNLILLPICAGAFGFQRRETTGRRWLWLPLTVMAASAAAVLVVRPPHPPVPPPTRPFAAFPAFPGASKPLGEGVSVLAFFSATCDHCKAASKALLDVQAVAAVYAVFFEEESEVLDFHATTDTFGVPWIRLDPALFFEHIGEAPPRVYVLNDGKVVRYWDGEVSVDELRQTLTPLLQRPGG
jgi:hypothetical protein